MKYCVMSNLRFETPAKRDVVHQAVQAQIAGKNTWGETLSHGGIDEDGYPYHNLAIRFKNATDMDELFALIKDKFDQIPILKGAVSKHHCSHDEGTRQPCKITKEYRKD